MIDGRRTGETLLAASDELVRLWRAARERAFAPRERRIDALVEPVLRAAGEALARGSPVGISAAAVAGVIRLDPEDPEGARLDVDAEWTTLAQVLAMTADALGADAAAHAALEQAVEAARAETAAAIDGARPSRIVVVWEWIARP